MQHGGVRNLKTKKAFTIIEIMVDLVVIGLVAAAILTAYSAAFKSMELAKAKIAAVALANEKMENLRNMPYDRLATEHGTIYPPGNILDQEIVVRRGVKFNILTTIDYIDDTYDGNAEGTVPGKEIDTYPVDYKKIEITVSKDGSRGFLARLTSNFSAKAAETLSNSGIIKLCVVDAAGLPVENATITIKNPDPTPPVDITAVTGLDGCIMVPNLPPNSHNKYNLTATKDGFSTDMTYPRTAQNPNALFPDVNVIVQQVTIQTLVIDRVGTLDLTVVNELGQPVANQGVHIESVKEKYFNPSTPVYVTDVTTDGQGKVVLPGLEFGDYKISAPGFNVLSISPYSPVYVKPAETILAKMIISSVSGYPSLISVDPATAKVGQSLQMTLNGADFSNGVQVKFSNGVSEIAGSITSSNHTTIDATFDLTGAASGFWDIIIINSDGKTVKQEKGVEIKNE